LVEVHTRDELQRAVNLGATLIGINNRNLHTFEVSLDTSRDLAAHAPDDVVLVAESGLNNFQELLKLKELGFAGFLIGARLMKSRQIENDLKTLRGR
ncbi:MAG: indole-3-glycerol-phosphate synthase TrpC, partial [Acidobacteria bacterium]|nr:indole-3-glycerol-phosphate synthase TrpC [Acidobacteriota bacterium]